MFFGLEAQKKTDSINNLKILMFKIALAQISPVWLNKEATIDKINIYIEKAAKEEAEMVVFGEALLPGYPYWLSHTGGASFNNKAQKEIHAHYIKQSIQIEKGDLDSICKLAQKHKIAVYLGMMERAQNRGGHSLYCTLCFIDNNGIIQSTHRKLQPTFEERLVWSMGDGNGLDVHEIGEYKFGGLNCWENWMPLTRAALYAQGENVHIAVWPGCLRNTEDITPFIAKESRSFSVSVSSLFSPLDIPKSTPHYDKMMEKMPKSISNGGSCIANPDGSWLIEPVIDKEVLLTGVLDVSKVYEERQNFDPSGHYSRPSVTQLRLNKSRQSTIEIIGE
jgi:nitrilase